MRLFQRHLKDVERAQLDADAAKKQAEAAKKQWADVRRSARRNGELRTANGWTEDIRDIFRGAT